MAVGESRMLVLHADDFGMSLPVNAGIRRAFTHGLLTSTSVLANAPACDEALVSWPRLLADFRSERLDSTPARMALRDSPADFDLGVHLNLTQGRPLTATFPSQLLNRDGCFLGTFGLFARIRRNPQQLQAGILAELRAQIGRVCDSGLHPTHLNGHQYIEMFPGVRELIPELLQEHSIRVVRVAHEARPTLNLRAWQWPSRLLAVVKARFGQRFRTLADQARLAHPAGFHGASHAGKIDRTTLRTFLDSPCEGTTEIALHPGEMGLRDSSNGWSDPLAELRTQELELLTAPDIVQMIAAARFRLGRLSEIPQPIAPVQSTRLGPRVR